MAARGSRRAPGPLKPERAWDYLLYLLSRRMYTTAELASRLQLRGIDEAQAQALLARLVELKLVDDVTYTDMYVSSRLASRGRLGLRRELAQKGVDPEVVEARLTELTPESQVEAAKELLEKNAWRYRPAEGLGTEERLKARAKAFAFLARRGFGVDAVQGALEKLGWFAGDD